MKTSLRKILSFVMVLCFAFICFFGVNVKAAETTETISFADTTQRKSYSTDQQVWEAGSVIFTNKKDASTTNVGDYSNPVRIYAKSKIIIACTSGNISSIVIESAGDTKYKDALNASLTGAEYTPTISGNSYTVTFDTAVQTFEFSATAQLRFKSLSVTYTQVEESEDVLQLKESLKDVEAKMSMAYKYVVTEGDSEGEAATGTYEVVFADADYANQGSVTSETNGIVLIQFAKGSNSSGNAPKYFDSGAAVRCYGGNTITFSSEDSQITEINFTFGTSDGSNTISADSGTYSDGSWTGNAQNVVFTIGGTSGHRRIAEIEVVYALSADSVAYDNVEFRIKCGISNTISGDEFALADSYGIKVYTADKENYYPSTDETLWRVDEENGLYYVVIDLGDVINKIDRASIEFNVCAYVEVDGVKYDSSEVKTYSVASLTKHYYEVKGLTQVQPLYELLVEKGIITE